MSNIKQPSQEQKEPIHFPTPIAFIKILDCIRNQKEARNIGIELKTNLNTPPLFKGTFADLTTSALLAFAKIKKEVLEIDEQDDGAASREPSQAYKDNCQQIALFLSVCQAVDPVIELLSRMAITRGWRDEQGEEHLETVTLAEAIEEIGREIQHYMGFSIETPTTGNFFEPQVDNFS